MRLKSRERGSTAIEFALTTLFWVPLLIGTSVMGINLIRSIQVTQICRDAGHMFAYGVDFTEPGNQDMLLRLANGFNITRTGGRGVIIFSQVTSIGNLQCTAAGKNANTVDCPNLNKSVITRRMVIGAKTLRSSSFGTPNPGIIKSDGYIDAADYLTSGSVVATGFSNLLPLAAGQSAFLTETFFSSTDLDWGSLTGTGIYSRSIF